MELEMKLEMELELELVSGNCCVLIQTNVGNCAFNVKMKKHCALLGQSARLPECQTADWDSHGWSRVFICTRCYIAWPKRASELGGASEINDPSFMFNLFES